MIKHISALYILTIVTILTLVTTKDLTGSTKKHTILESIQTSPMSLIITYALRMKILLSQ